MPVVPVFVSSTFRDFHGERDALRRMVTPRLDEVLAPHGSRVELLDLRWGVATEGADDEEAAHRQVLDVCLREIDRCRPLFLGLVGDRLGWVPSRSRLEYAARRAGIGGVLPHGPEQGLSITALEFWHGAFASDAEAVFALRTLIGDVPADWIESGLEASSWLRAQVTEVHERDPDRVKVLEYVAEVEDGRVQQSCLDDLADQLVETLAPLVKARATELCATSYSAYEGAARLQAESISEVFLGRDEFIDLVLDGFDATEQHRGVVLHGPSGMGKTAVWLAAIDRLRSQGRNVASVMVGVGPGSSTVDEVISLLAGQLGLEIPTDTVFGTEARWAPITDALGLGDSRVPLVGEPLWQWWATALRRLPPMTVVAIDGIDRLAPGAGRDDLALLRIAPSSCSADLFVTTADEPQSAFLRERGWTALQAPPITSGAVGRVAAAWASVLGGRELPARALATMAMRPRSGIWIRLAVEELAWLDSDDFAAAEALQAQGVPAEHALASMVVRATNDMPDDDLDMAQRLIGRVEQVFEDPRQADLYLACLSLTRSGLSSDDLSTIVGAVPRVTARARWILGGQLTQRDESGRLTIDHPLVLEAARSHIPSAGGHREVHNRLASHVRALAQPTSMAQGARDSIAWADLLWHAMLAGDSTIALSVLDDPAPLSPAELGGIVSSAIIAGRREGAPALKVVEELSEQRQTSPWWHPLLLAFVAELNGRTPAENLTMGRVVHQAVRNPDACQDPGAWVGALVDVQLAESFRRIRDHHTSRVLAIAAFDRCADAESWVGSPPEARDMSSALALLALSRATLPLGNMDEAQAAAAGAERAASRLTASMSNDHLVILTLLEVAFVIAEKATDGRSREDARKAEQRCRSACQQWRSRYGSEIGQSPSTIAAASSVMQIEFMMAATGGEDPGDMAQIVNDARRWLSVLPDDFGARKMLIQGLLYRSWAERENKRPAEARLALEEAEGLVRELLEMDPDDLESESMFADVCNEHGEQLLEIPLRLTEFADEALRWFQQGLDHNRRLARANPTDRWATARVLESLLHVIKAAVPAGNARVAQIACGELETLSSEWLQADPLGVEARECRYLAALNRSWVLQEFSFEDRDARRAAHARLIAAIDALGEVSELEQSQQEERSQSLAALRALEQPTPSPMAGSNASFVGPSAASTGMTASHRLGALVDAEPNCGGRDAVLNLIHLMLSWPALPRKLRKRYGVLHMRDRKELGLTIMDLRGYEHPTPIDWDHWDAAVNALDERLPNLGGVVRRAIRAGVADWEEIAGYLDLPGHDG